MERKMIITNIGTISLKLEKAKLIVTEVPKENEAKFREKYPDGIIGDFSDYYIPNKFAEVFTEFIKSIQ